ncbi:hypothetical protein L1887_54006 [Cichorium endivia]|nr:hypothetical protein L1887_54006 [Cichorium endivia]
MSRTSLRGPAGRSSRTKSPSKSNRGSNGLSISHHRDCLCATVLCSVLDAQDAARGRGRSSSQLGPCTLSARRHVDARCHLAVRPRGLSTIDLPPTSGPDECTQIPSMLAISIHLEASPSTFGRTGLCRSRFASPPISPRTRTLGWRVQDTRYGAHHPAPVQVLNKRLLILDFGNGIDSMAIHIPSAPTSYCKAQLHSHHHARLGQRLRGGILFVAFASITRSHKLTGTLVLRRPQSLVSYLAIHRSATSTDRHR